MRFLKVRFRLLIFGLITLFLSSCSIGEVTFQPYHQELTPFIQSAVSEAHYYRPSHYSDDFTALRREHPQGAQKTVTMETTGAQRLLVIPVDFTDYRADSLNEGRTGSRTVIQNAFFGRSGSTQWESVSSFYHTSSYGQLLFEGFVSDWFSSNESVSALRSSGSKTVATERILKAAIEWYKQTYDDITYFDQDSDGYLDGVFLVYAAPYLDNDSVFWAFTSFDTGIDGSLYVGNPIGNGYVWASYHFLNVYRGKGDPHTFIHEVGHLLGLTDYYNTSSIPSSFTPFVETDSIFKRYQYTHGPTGKVDMMDYSIGDHTVLSKMLLNWTRPYVVTAPGLITIRPFTETGDAIIVAANWNGKAFDEYLAIEFYAPSGLNFVDSERAYGHASARLMGNRGIKVYHVDARASYHRTSGDTFIGYENEVDQGDLPAPGSFYRNVIHTNTYATTTNENLIYRLLEKGGTTSFLTGAMASNETLFYPQDQFGYDSFYNFTFNSGQRVPFRFEVVSLDRYRATLRFSV